MFAVTNCKSCRCLALKAVILSLRFQETKGDDDLIYER